MEKSITHITFERGSEIKLAFAKAMVSPDQRRDPGASDGYWLVQDNAERVRDIAEKTGQAFVQIKADSFHP